MALATTCPSCKTSFKVNPEQLKLRRGLVRCGMCQNVFSGIEFVRYVSDARAAKTRRTNKEAVAKTTTERNDSGENSSIAAEPPQTVIDDLKTAFFLPETQFADSTPNTTVAGASTQARDTTAPTAASPTERTPNAPQLPAAKKEPPSGSAKANRKAARRNRRKNRRNEELPRHERSGAAPPTTTQTPATQHTNKPDAPVAGKVEAAPTSNAPAKTTPQVETASTVGAPTAVTAATTTSIQSKSSQPAQKTPTPAAASVVPASLSTADAPDEVFQDTLQANLPQAWQTTSAWPSLEESLTDTHPPGNVKPAPTKVDKYSQSAPRQTQSTNPSDHASERAAPQAADVANDQPIRSRPQIDPAGDIETGNQSSLHAEVDWDNALAYDDQGHRGHSATSSASGDEDAIDFFGRTSKPAFDFDLPPRGVRIAAAGLILLLALQIAIGSRDSLAAHFPIVKPLLESISKPLGLTIELPIRPDAVTIQSFDLAGPPTGAPASEATDYVMNMLMRNKSPAAAKWPAVELSLTDSTGGILVRKVLMPKDYLSDPARIPKGMAGLSEEPIRVGLRSHGILALRYSAILFYP